MRKVQAIQREERLNGVLATSITYLLLLVQGRYGGGVRGIINRAAATLKDFISIRGLSRVVSNKGRLSMFVGFGWK